MIGLARRLLIPAVAALAAARAVGAPVQEQQPAMDIRLSPVLTPPGFGERPYGPSDRADPRVTLSMSGDLSEVLGQLHASFGVNCVARLSDEARVKHEVRLKDAAFSKAIGDICRLWGVAWCDVHGIIVMRPPAALPHDHATTLAGGAEPDVTAAWTREDDDEHVAVRTVDCPLSHLLQTLSVARSNARDTGTGPRPDGLLPDFMVWCAAPQLGCTRVTVFCAEVSPWGLTPALEVATGGYWSGFRSFQVLREGPAEALAAARALAQGNEWLGEVDLRQIQTGRSQKDVLRDILREEVLRRLTDWDVYQLGMPPLSPQPGAPGAPPSFGPYSMPHSMELRFAELPLRGAAAFVALCELPSERWSGKIDLAGPERMRVAIKLELVPDTAGPNPKLAARVDVYCNAPGHGTMYGF